jgi:hypothetical protein
MTSDSKVALPYKLTSDMSWKCWDDHTAAFKSLVDAVALVCPGISLESQNRYSAFYRNGKIIVYVEPQRWRILFGFFADYIRFPGERIATPTTDFPEWNTSKGGLVGVSLQGHGDELTPCVADIAYLIIESFKRSQQRNPAYK